MKKTTKYMFVFIFIFILILPATASYGASQDGALTSPPPMVIQPMGFFDSTNTYLEQGSVKIGVNSDGTATITVDTVAKSTVASIGGTVNLQKWTGSAWIDVGTTTTLSGTNKWYFTGEVTKTTESGYYFRTRTTHWISNGSVYEQGIMYSNSFLAS
ncbi:MAG: hypothetical protein ACE3L7_04830 [Candidatus Pristimantibacillus sp.]